MTSPQTKTLSKLDTILDNRGLLESAKIAGLQEHKRYNADGWSIPTFDPLTGESAGIFWKNADSTSKYKYMPLDENLGQWYLSNPFKVQSEIARNNGIVYIANGVPSLLAYNEAGIYNVVASIRETSIPDNVLEVFNAYGVTRARYVFDNDHAGLTAAIAWRDALQDSTIDYRAYSWGNDKPAKYDANDAWISCGFERLMFRAMLHTTINTTLVTLPAPLKPRLMQPVFSGENSTRGKLIETLETALLGQGYTPNNRGYINGRCIFSKNHKHDDKKHSAGMDTLTGVYHCFSCGSFSPEAIATELNIPLPEKEAPVYKNACEVGLYNTLREKLNTSKLTKVAIILEAYHMNNNADTGVLLTIDEFIERMGKYGKDMSCSSVYTALNSTIRGYLGRVFTFSNKDDAMASNYSIFTQDGVFFDFFTLLIEYSKEGSKSKNTTKPKKQYYIPSQSELADLLGIQLKDRSPISVRCLEGVKQYRQESLVKVYKNIESTDISNKKIGAFVGVGRATASRYIDEHKNLHKKHNPPAIIRTIKRSSPILPKHKGRIQWLQVQGSDHRYPYTQASIDRIFSSPRNHEAIEVYAPSCNTVSYVPDDSPVIVEFETMINQYKDIAS